MTQEQADTIVGRIIREEREAKRTHNLLAAEARRIEQLLLNLARDLRPNPQTITVKRVEEIEKIVNLAEEIEETTKKLNDLQEQAASLGLEAD